VGSAFPCPSTPWTLSSLTPLPGTRSHRQRPEKLLASFFHAVQATPGRTPLITAPTCSPLSNRPIAVSPFLNAATPVNDQRHRWVTSGVFQTSPHKGGDSFAQRLLQRFSRSLHSSRFLPVGRSTSSLREDTRLDSALPKSVRHRPRRTARRHQPPRFIPGVALGIPTTCLTNAGQPFTLNGTPALWVHRQSRSRQIHHALFLPVPISASPRASASANDSVIDLIADAFNLFNHTKHFRGEPALRHPGPHHLRRRPVNRPPSTPASSSSP